MPKTKLPEKEIKDEAREWRRWHRVRPSSASNALYGIGVLGALVYFVQHAASFGDGLIGVVKAIFWPALIVYKALEQLKF